LLVELEHLKIKTTLIVEMLWRVGTGEGGKKKDWPPKMVSLAKCSALMGILAAPAMGFRYGSFAIFGVYLRPSSA
jgi:hypothetical protein